MTALILLIAAVILLILAAVGVSGGPRFNLLAAGLACFVLAALAEGRAP